MFGRKLRAKYGAKRQELDGYSFASKLEASVYQVLKIRERAGEIKVLQVQDHVRVCGPPGHECGHNFKVELVVDFKAVRSDGSVFYVEAKGFKTPAYAIKRRLWVHNRVGVLEVWGGSHLRPVLMEVLGE